MLDAKKQLTGGMDELSLWGMTGLIKEHFWSTAEEIEHSLWEWEEVFQLLNLIVIIIGVIRRNQSSGDPGISMKLTVPSQDLLKKDMLLKWLLVMIPQFSKLIWNVSSHNFCIHCSLYKRNCYWYLKESPRESRYFSMCV